MQVMDIVNRAVMKSGVVSNFNPDEVPEDIQQRAADVLRNEIIEDLNCDRAVDISETVVTLTPNEDKIDLITTPLDYGKFIIGSVGETAPFLMECITRSLTPGAQPVYIPTHLVDLLEELGYYQLDPEYSGTRYTNLVKTDKWPTTQLGEYRDLALWTSDFKLIEVPANFGNPYPVEQPNLVNKRYNVPFYPAYIDEVYRANDGAPLMYIHHGEMVSAEFRHSQLVFTLEDNITRMTIRFTRNFNNSPAAIVLPVPVKVINSYEEPNPWQGEIVAPRKFRSFLINMLAWRMAIEYGVDTKEDMRLQSTTSYTNIIKNKVKREHPQDIERRIFHYLRRGHGFRTGVGGNGYSGGYYG